LNHWKIVGDKNGITSVYIFLALIPFVIALFVSGKLKEIKGPGGIGLSLRDEISKQVSPDFSDQPIEVAEEIVGDKGLVSRLQSEVAKRPTSLSFEIGRRNYYGQWAIAEYVSELSRNPEFRFILFKDSNNGFLGLMHVEYYKNLLRRNDIVNEIESGSILNRPEVNRTKIAQSVSNREALSIMDREGCNELVVVDSSNKFIGVITQDAIVRKVLGKALQKA
jgi:hypothetical protein